MISTRKAASLPRNFLPTDQRSTHSSWPVRFAAALCAVAVAVGGVHLIVPDKPPAAQTFANASVDAFADSPVATTTATSSAEQRRTGLPTDPVAGLTSITPAGPVQLVLPGGLGPAEHTTGGQVVYPDRGVGFDLLAENTGNGYRTVSRIAGPDGARAVTTFVRTPADTVMLAHTNGYLTINRATPTAETVGMFSPAESRDATGKLIPSSYVVRQVAPQLYQLTEVVDPGPQTVWPVYADPPLVTGPGGPLPQGLFESISGAVSAAASATVSAATAVGTFVQENPLESAMIVGGVALALTGVGGPASAAMIAAATVNIASAGVDVAATVMPDNKALGIASATLGVASMFTPQGAAKKVVEEGVELGVEQLAIHSDDILDVATAIPTAPAQLADDIAGSTPGIVPGGEGAWPLPPAAGDMRLSTNIDSRVPFRADTVTDVHAAAEIDRVTGLPKDGNNRGGHLRQARYRTRAGLRI